MDIIAALFYSPVETHNSHLVMLLFLFANGTYGCNVHLFWALSSPGSSGNQHWYDVGYNIYLSASLLQSLIRAEK